MPDDASAGTPDDWSHVFDDIADWSQADMAGYVGCEAGVWREENPSPHSMTWSFVWMDPAVVARAMDGGVDAWHEWLEDERSHLDRGAPAPEYVNDLEAAWLSRPLALGPVIVVVWADGRIDIGDGWHRAAVSIVHGLPIPCLVSDPLLGTEP